VTPLLTIFTCPKPFTREPIARIQDNALGSWRALGPEVEVLLLGDDEGVAAAARRLGVRHLPDVAKSAWGTPLVSSLFAQAEAACATPLLAWVNADIILLPDFARAVRDVAAGAARFLMVGGRRDLRFDAALDFAPGWEEQLQLAVRRRGRAHPPAGSDYFVFPRGVLGPLPDFSVGRAGWDNWMIFRGRTLGLAVVDATAAVCAVHQEHDYDHLGGERVHRHPESLHNKRLAGGRSLGTFALADADHELAGGRLVRRPPRWRALRRELQVRLLVRWPSRRVGEVIRTLLYPIRTGRERLGARPRRVRRT
jgi:hypothetical protein